MFDFYVYSLVLSHILRCFWGLHNPFINRIYRSACWMKLSPHNDWAMIRHGGWGDTVGSNPSSHTHGWGVQFWGCPTRVIPAGCQVLARQVPLILTYSPSLWTWLSRSEVAVVLVWSTSGGLKVRAQCNSEVEILGLISVTFRAAGATDSTNTPILCFQHWEIVLCS